MKLKNILLAGVSMTVLLSSCDKFDTINTNPDSTTRVTSAMLATGLIMDIMEPGGSKNFLDYNLLEQHMAWGESSVFDMQYGKLERQGLNDYYSLTNCEKMVEIASETDKSAYEGLALFIKTYRLYYLTMRLGDIPYSEAGKGETEGNFTPKYDTQREVFVQLLSDLEKSYTCFSNATQAFGGDVIFDGNIENWKKVVTAFQLKVLMSLSKRTDDTDLDVKGKFAKIVSNGSLMTSNDDNLKLVFTSTDGQRYPFYVKETNQTAYPIVASMVIDNFKNLNDYRLFYYANPSKAKLEAGVAVDAYDAYMSVDASDELSKIITQYGAGEYCALNDRYTQRAEGEPFNRLGYAEQQLILAEAVVRGWIGGDAATYYNEGIRANMKFVADATPDDAAYHHNRPITDSYIEQYLTQANVLLTGDTEADIEKIILQRYLASFMQYPYDAYFDYRRTGYPKWKVNPNTCINEVATQFALRWRYSEDEYNVNNANVNEAVERQFGSAGDINNGVMWILK